jgi:hypothetical protein
VVTEPPNHVTRKGETALTSPGLRVLFTTGHTRNDIVHGGALDPGVNFISSPVD